MSEELDTLLAKMNESLGGRVESDVPLNDDYWKHRTAYQQALTLADGKHVPVGLSERTPIVMDVGVESEIIPEVEKPKTAEEQLKALGL